jgi:Flp pilus assembly protein TadG
MRAIGYPFLRRFVRRLARNTSGNAIMFVALGLPVFIGAAGYAVDLAQAYAWKRELQHSVDQAAIAGAWALAYDKDTTTYTTRAQQEFDANLAVTKTFADADATVQLGTYGSTTNNSVIVSASASKRLPFSGYLINHAMTVFARAQATYAEGGKYKACLMALKKGDAADGSEDSANVFTVGGSAVVNASCGLGALSCADGAIKIDVDSTDPTKKGVTTDSIVTCGTAVVPDYLKTKVTDNATGVDNPFADLPAPTPADNSAKSLNCPNGNAASTTTTTIQPGRYVGGMNMKCKIVMAKGIYVVDGGVLDMSDQKANVDGTQGVMFVLKHGAQLRLGGQGNAGALNLTPMEAADYVGTANEAYKDLYGGMLIYEDSTGQTSPVSHDFNGNSSITMRGTIYLPNGNLSINGNSNTTPLCFQLWSLTLTISGNTSISTTCTSTETNSAGSTVGGVRLVA